MFDPALADRILDAMAQGSSLKAACELEGLTMRVWWDWCDAHPTLAASYRLARARLAECYVDQMPSIADTEADPQRARAKIDARRWVASKWKPDVYGDKIDVNVTGQVDLVAAITDAQSRMLRLGCDQAKVLDVEYVDITAQKAIGAADSESVSSPDDVDIFS